MKLFYTFGGGGECVSEPVFYLNEIFIYDRRRMFALYFMRNWGKRKKSYLFEFRLLRLLCTRRVRNSDVRTYNKLHATPAVRVVAGAKLRNANASSAFFEIIMLRRRTNCCLNTPNLCGPLVRLVRKHNNNVNINMSRIRKRTTLV